MRRLRPGALNSKFVLDPRVDPDLSPMSLSLKGDLKNSVAFGLRESGSETEN